MQQGANSVLQRRADTTAAGLLCFLCLQLAASAVYSLLRRGYGGALSPTILGLVRLAVSACLLALPLLFLLRAGRPLGLRLKTGASRLPTALLLPLFLLAMLGLNLLVSVLRGAVYSVLEPLPVKSSALPSGSLPLILYYLSACVLPAVLEELLFRGAVQGLLRAYGQRTGIFVTTLLFTLMHTGGWDSITIFTLSLLLCWVREACRSVWPCVILHLANNTVAFGALLLQQHAPGLLWRFLLPLCVLFLLWAAFVVFALRKRRAGRWLRLQLGAGLGFGLTRLSHSRRFTAMLFICIVYFTARTVLV